MLVRIICLIGVALIAESKAALVGDCPGINLNCTIYRYFGDECSAPALRAEFPGMYETNSSSFPGMPGSLDISARYKYRPDKNKYKPEANLTFTTPQSGAKNYVKGFEIIRIAPGMVQPTCYILDLSSVIWNDNLEELSTLFRLELFPLQYRFYSFTLYALPKQETKDAVYDQYIRKYMELPEYTDDRTAGRWKASIFIVQNNEAGSVTVSIDPPPEDFGFEQFEYTLLHASTNTPMQSETLEKRSMVFEGLYDNETYKVWVKPYDPYYLTMDPDQCLCLDADGLACAQCQTTTTQEFTYVYTGPPPITPTTPTSTTPTTPTSTTPTAIKVPDLTPETEITTKSEQTRVTMEPKEESNVKVAVAVVGTLLGLCLILGVAGFMYHRRCRASYDDKPDPKGGHGLPLENPGYNGSPLNKGPNNINAEKLKFEKRPKLVLLYEEDHEYHRQVVQHYASFLQQHCQCAAMCVEWQLDAPWVHEDIAQADFVVIVNSEGAYQSYMSQYGHKGNANGQFKGPQISKQMSNINSIRNKFLHDERYDNVVMVYFEYTDEQFVLPDICPGYKYKLLKHFTDFLLHIHKLRRTHNLSLYDLPFDGSFSKKLIGQQLLDSMHKAVQFQNENPNWAKKRLAYNRMVSHTSEESQFDSGLPDDWLRSVDHTLPSFESPNQRELLRILDGNSICTVNPSDIGVTVPADYNALPSVSENVPSHSVSKLRPKLSPHSFDGNPNVPNYLNTPSPPTCSTVESDFGFFPPDDFDDNYDAVSKTVSEQMKSIVDRYQASNHSKSHKPERPVTTHYENEAHVNGALEQADVNPNENYDRNNDLYLLKVQSGEISFISCNIDSDAVSLGGESV